MDRRPGCQLQLQVKGNAHVGSRQQTTMAPSELPMVLARHTAQPVSKARLPPTLPPCSSDGRQALAFPDLIPYLLANFETVQEVVDFMDPAEVQGVVHA